MDKIDFRFEDKVATITIDNPCTRNAFDAEMSKAVISCLEQAEKLGVRVVVIKAQTSHGIFSAGHDLNEYRPDDDLADDPIFAMFEAIYASPLPVIAQVEGTVYAGALWLLLAADLVYALKTASVVMTANRLGILFNPKDYSRFLSVAGLHSIKELFLTAAPMNAEDARCAGIFNDIFETPVALDRRIGAVANRIARCTPQGIANTKLQLNQLASAVPLSDEQTAGIACKRAELLKDPALLTRTQTLMTHLHGASGKKRGPLPHPTQIRDR
ncbi:UNVERIFIED_ORG: methylmalonyl-CoA decarboxylase [Martelella mediterranea]